MLRMLLPALLVATMCATACAPAPSSSRPCPRVTEFPVELQRRAAEELKTAPAAREIMQGVAVERAYNRAICP